MRREPLIVTMVFVTMAFVCTGCGEGQFTAVQDAIVPITHVVRDHPFQGEGKSLTDWWNAFADQPLQTLLATAQANNHDLNLAQEKLRQVSYQYGLNEREAESHVQGLAVAPKSSAMDAAPQINDSFINAYMVGDNLPFSVGGISDKFNVHFFSGTFNIDLFSAMQQQLAAAKHDITQVGEAAKSVAAAIRNQLSKEYVNLRLNQNLQEFLQTSGNQLQTLLTQLQERIGAGLNTASDAADGTDFLQQIQLLLHDVENNIQSSIHNITTLTGTTNTDATNAIVGATGPIPAAQENLLAGTPIDTVKNRADLRTKLAQLHQANAESNIAVTDQFPSLVINAGLESSASGIMQLLNGGNLSHALGIQLSKNFLNTTSSNANIRVQKSKLQQAQIDYNRAITNALTEVGQSMINVVTARKKDTIHQTAATKLQNTLEEASALTQQDGKNIVKLISAHQSKILADINAMQSSANVTQNMLDLLAALGG